MSNASIFLENVTAPETVETQCSKTESKRVGNASESALEPEGGEMLEVPAESKQGDEEEASESTPSLDKEAENSQPQSNSNTAASPGNTKSGKRTREDYEKPGPDAEDGSDERLPPLPIPKRSATSRSVAQVKEFSDEAPGQPAETVKAEDVPLPSSASDVSDTPSTAVNEETETSPKAPVESVEEDADDARLLRFKRRRITDSLRGLVNSMSARFDSISSAFSFV